jgi:hypothetical protein
MTTTASSPCLRLGDLDVRVDGRVLRTASLQDEYYVPAGEPDKLVAGLKANRRGIDLFTFVQELHEPEPRFGAPSGWDEMAVLRVSTYQHWFDKQITFKPRNKLRKAWKNGIDTRVVPFSDELLGGIKSIYNETPLRQGKRNWHYGKDLATLEREHATFLDRSEFIGAYLQDELVGFAKVTHGPHYSIIMNIVATLAQRDKAPMNALIAKTIERVAARQIPLLNYGVWGRRGLNEFKVANGFECVTIPRYFVPLTARGRVALKLQLHRGFKERLPEPWIVRAADARANWNTWWYATLGDLRSRPRKREA